jgi:phage gp29-like protein
VRVRLNGKRPPVGNGKITPQRVELSLRQRFNPIRMLTPELLATQLDQFARGVLSPIMRTWETMERRDDRLASVAAKAKGALARYGFEIVMAQDAPSAEAVRHKEALDYFYRNLTVTDAYDENRVGGFSLLVRTMAHAIGRKYSVHEICWQPGESGLTAEFRAAPGWFFENLTGRLRFLAQDFDYMGVPMNPDEWLVTVGDGIDEACSVAYMFKHLPLKDWLNYSEKFGFPGILGKTAASQGSDQWDAMKAAVAAFANDFAAVCNVSDTIELIKPEGSQGTTPFQPIVEMMDRAMAILWRGADLGTQSHHGAGQGQGATLQQDETDALDEDRAQMLSETLNIQIDRRVLAFTFGAGVTPLAAVRIKTREARDLSFDLQAIAALVPLGLPISVADALGRFGFSQPAQGEAVLKAPVIPEQQEEP